MHNTSNGSLIIRRHLEPPDYMLEWCCQRRPLRRVRRKTKREMTALLVVRRNTGKTSAQSSTKKPGQDSKFVNVTLSNNDGASGYGDLFTVLSVCESTDWWVDAGANIHVCADVSLFSCSI